MTRKRLSDSAKKNYEALAHKLFTAFLSHRLDISYRTASRQYVAKEPIGKFWVRLAELVEESAVAKLESVASGKAKRR